MSNGNGKESMKQTKVKIDMGEPPIEKTVLATAIVDLCKSARELLDSQLTERAVVLLLADSSEVNMTQVRAVLHALRDLEKTYCKPKTKPGK